MLRLRGLLGADFVHDGGLQDARKLGLAALMHVDIVRQAESGKRYHDAADLLVDVALVPSIDVIDELMRFAGGTPACLHEL
jgi:hypothetical protein